MTIRIYTRVHLNYIYLLITICTHAVHIYLLITICIIYTRI